MRARPKGEKGVSPRAAVAKEVLVESKARGERVARVVSAAPPRKVARPRAPLVVLQEEAEGEEEAHLAVLGALRVRAVPRARLHKGDRQARRPPSLGQVCSSPGAT